jgi:RNA polymerase sigma factor (sigma-70 family)
MLPVDTLFQEAKLPARDRRRARTFLERVDGAADVLTQLIDRLPERQRIALALRYYEALRPDEIAVVLGLREDMVHDLLRKAAETVSEGMAGCEEERKPPAPRRRR